MKTTWWEAFLEGAGQTSPYVQQQHTQTEFSEESLISYFLFGFSGLLILLLFVLILKTR